MHWKINKCNLHTNIHSKWCLVSKTKLLFYLFFSIYCKGRNPIYISYNPEKTQPGIQIGSTNFEYYRGGGFASMGVNIYTILLVYKG